MSDKMSMPHKDGFIPVLKSGMILTMPQGGPIVYRTTTEAGRHSSLYENGWTGGAIPRNAEDVI